MDLSSQLAAVPRLEPATPAWQYRGGWWPWSHLTDAIRTLDGALVAAGCGDGAQVGVLMRNRPEVAATVVALLATRRCLVTLSTMLPPAVVAEELRGLRLPAVLAVAADLGPELREACRAAGTTLLVLAGDDAGVSVRVDQPGEPGAEHAPPTPEVAVRMLTSGTTGRPKRIELSYRSLELEAASTRRYSHGGADSGELRLSSGTSILWIPLLHVAGVRSVIASVLDGRRLALMERFDIPVWAELVREHRPKTVQLVPTALRMVYDAGGEGRLPADLFDGVKAVFCGTAPLDPEFGAAFTERFGVPVLTIYGATEFAGGVAGWTLRDWREFGAAKAASVGRANAGIELRVVDQVSGEPLDPDLDGVLEVRGAQLGGDGWVRTTDLARLDAEGFLYILGRADGVIIRGGLKVHAAEVERALRGHPAVRDAAVLGVPDARLGAVPVAAVEPEPDVAAPAEPELLEHLRGRLAAYQLPVRVLVLDRLPRTPSMKVSQPDLRRHPEFGGDGGTDGDGG